MKKTITAIFSLAFLLLAANSFAQKSREKYEHVKEKSFTRIYPASGNSLSIENSFGDVKFTTWDKNEVKVDVKIEVSSDNAGQAQRTFDAIEVTDKKAGSEIQFKTSINNKNKEGKEQQKGTKTSMHIDYTVSLPASMALQVTNSFGSIEIPDYSGAANLTSKFGSLNAGHLSNPKAVSVEFGAAEIKKSANLKGDFKFSSVTIASLSGTCDISVSFGSTKIGLENNLSGLKLENSYSAVNLRPQGSLSATYNISTSFGSFTDRTGAGIKRTDTPQKYGPDSEKKYSGQSGSGNAKITISSSFGSVVLGEPTAEDLKKLESKDKQKNKTKNTRNI